MHSTLCGRAHAAVRFARHASALAVCLLATSGASRALAQTANAGAPGEWLAQYTTARSLGLGGAYVAAGTDPLGVLWNPASLSFMDQDELRVENARLFGESTINGASFAVPGSRLPSFGLSVVSLRSGSFDRTNEMNDPLGEFTESQTAYFFTLSRALSPRAALGANLKLVQHSIEESSGGGVGADVGAMVALSSALRAGVSVMNLGGPTVTMRDTEEKYPMQLRGGLGLSVLGGRGLLAAEVDHTEGLGAQVRAGSEYWVQPGFALRVGYAGERGGGGFTYRFAPQYQLDYAVADHPLGMTQRIGVSWRFGGFHASSRAEPEVFSPTGEHAVTRISLNSSTKAAAATWKLEIIDKGGQTVRTFGGQGQPPSHVEWDGKDETGMPLADGSYKYRLLVTDGEQRIVSSAIRSLEIATGGPEGTVPVIPLEQQ